MMTIHAILAASLLMTIQSSHSFAWPSYSYHSSSHARHHLARKTQQSVIHNYNLLLLPWKKNEYVEDDDSSVIATRLHSSFYNDFEDFDFDEEDDEDEDDEDDEDEYADFDDQSVAYFKKKMGNLFGEGSGSEDDLEPLTEELSPSSSSTSSFSSLDELISFATSQSSSSLSSTSTNKESEPTDWATPINPSDAASSLQGGLVLIANPEKFCSDFTTPITNESSSSAKNNNKNNFRPSPALLAKFGLTLPPPVELGPDRRADLLPVMVLLDKHPLKGCQALLLNRRTGYLMGDLEETPPLPTDNQSTSSSSPPSQSQLQPKLGAFMIQPLWFGGTSSSNAYQPSSSSSNKNNNNNNKCPTVPNAKQITEDGLYWGGDPVDAVDAMNDPSFERPMSGFDFKFFVQSTRWLPTQLENEIRDGTWFVAKVSKEVLFKSRDRLGLKRAKPLWTEVMELLGGSYQSMCQSLYNDENDYYSNQDEDPNDDFDFGGF